MPVTVISRYDYEKRAEVAPAVHFDPKKNKADRSMTNQADMDAADINQIMARYEKTGVLVDPLTSVERKPMYGDFTLIKDYHTTLSAIRRTEAAFALLPANVRNRFKNDPQALIEFLDDPKNNQEAIELGLIDRPAAPPVPADVQAAADLEVQKQKGAGGPAAAPVPPAQ